MDVVADSTAFTSLEDPSTGHTEVIVQHFDWIGYADSAVLVRQRPRGQLAILHANLRGPFEHGSIEYQDTFTQNGASCSVNSSKEAGWTRIRASVTVATGPALLYAPRGGSFAFSGEAAQYAGIPGRANWDVHRAEGTCPFCLSSPPAWVGESRHTPAGVSCGQPGGDTVEFLGGSDELEGDPQFFAAPYLLDGPVTTSSTYRIEGPFGRHNPRHGHHPPVAEVPILGDLVIRVEYKSHRPDAGTQSPNPMGVHLGWESSREVVAFELVLCPHHGLEPC
jgi:hypothetical protein